MVACFSFLFGVRTYVNNSITGDEPHYLLMSYSLMHDKDLNLKNNFENDDAKTFYPGLSADQQVGLGQGTSNSDRWYSIHGIGLPIMLLPGFAIAGKAGAVFTMVLLATITIWLTMAWTYQVTNNRRLSYFAAASMLCMYSYNGLAGYIYPDVVVAGLTLAALLIIERHYGQWVFRSLVGLICGFLLLLHLKTIVIGGPLLLLLAYKLWREEKRLPWEGVIIFIAMLVYFFLSNHGWFGVWNPTKIYGGLTFYSASPLAITSAILFDSMRGLLIYNPIMLLIFVGLPVWYKRSRRSLFFALFVTLPSIVAFGTFRGWNGGDSQIGRYAIDFLPILIPAVAFAVDALKQCWQRIIIGILFTATIFISLYSAFIKRPYVRSEMRSPIFVSVERHTGVKFDRLLPTFNQQTRLTNRNGALKIAIGYMAISGLVVYGWKLGKIKPHSPRSHRSRTRG